MTYAQIALAVLGLVLAFTADASAGPKSVRVPSAAEIQKMETAAPQKAPAKPAKPRKLLVWGHMWTHEPVPYAAKCLEVMGKKSGAFEAVVSDDLALLLPDKLQEFDALVMNNTHEGEPFLPADLAKLPKDQQEAARKRDQIIKKSVLDFVSGGKGLVGIHATTAACQNWPEYGQMVGGYYGGHIAQRVPIKLDDPRHPVNACFQGKGFQIQDEIYLFRAPYSRGKLRVLLSLDLSQMQDPGKRPDKDYAVSWVRAYGKGRVFYCSLGHASATYWNPLVLEHFLAGIQFAIGDLPGETAPSEPPAAGQEKAKGE